MNLNQRKARNLLQQEPGRENRHANAALSQTVPQREANRNRVGTAYRVATKSGNTFSIVVSGRVRWALDRLIHAGATGCTPITEPAPRWSAYVFSLRELGVEIETITERHKGDFPGHHARYVLRSAVVRNWKGGEA